MNFPIPFVCADYKARADAKAAYTLAVAGTNAAAAANLKATAAYTLAVAGTNAASAANLKATDAYNTAAAALATANDALNGVGVVTTLVDDIDGSPPRVYVEDVYKDFVVKVAGDQWHVSWDYSYCAHNKDYVYASQDEGRTWIAYGSRYNDQSHQFKAAPLAVEQPLFAIAGFIMNDSAGVRVRITEWAYTRLSYITSFTTEHYDANNLVSKWTVGGTVPPTLTGFYIYASADGGPYFRATTFDAYELMSTWGKPAFSATLDTYLVAHDAAQQPVAPPSATVRISV